MGRSEGHTRRYISTVCGMVGQRFAGVWGRQQMLSQVLFFVP
jgi:hypothetical protein